MGAFYVVFMRGYSSPDPTRTAGFDFRRQVADRFGLLPPSKDALGITLWCITTAAFIAAIGFFLVGDRYIGVSNGVMIVSFLITLWRDDRWLKRQPGYLEARDAASSGPTDDDDGDE